MFKCPRCATENGYQAQFCSRCGMQFAQAAPPTAAQTNNAPQIDCQACRAPASMVAAKIPRFSNILRLIGVIILIPSFLGLSVSALMFIGAISSQAAMTGAQSDAEIAGRGIGVALVGGFILVIAAISLVSGLVGWLLLLTRKVFKCVRCGFVMDRA